MTSQAAFGPPFFPKGDVPLFQKGRLPFSKGMFHFTKSADHPATDSTKGRRPFWKRETPPLVLLLAAALCAGCVTTRIYDGPPLPASERAIVRADPPVSAGLPVQVRLRQVDGREISLQTSAVELAPGAHELLVDCRVAESGSVGRFVLEVELAAGAEYRLVATATGRNCEAVELIRH